MTAYLSYTDNQLFDLVKEDDQTAFRLLYERYWNKLLVQAYVKLRSHEEAEEIVQEVFLYLWNKRSAIRITHKFHTYIASIVKYQIFGKLAKLREERMLQQNMAASMADEDNSTVISMQYESLRKEIEKTVQSLPEKCRLVFRLSREEGLSEKQIAATLKIAPKTVEAHMSKALKKLRTSMQLYFSFFF